jgi:DNA topoisomerase I
MNLVNAQQARRILDRLVGYKISPLLWKKVKRGLSAGRVQSVAVKLIVDRERQIQAFDPEEYWTIEADFKLSREGKTRRVDQFRANLHSIKGKRLELTNEADTNAILKDLDGAGYVVGEVRQTKSQRKPAAPFTTSTLQQEASRKLNYTSRKTMGIAQNLYEGIDLGKEEGTQGLITYMRTDSTTVAAVAQEEAKQLITLKYGAEYVPETPPVYAKKSKNAQEAHEAVRPTSAMREPDAIKAFLTGEQYKLYRLIWQRFVASQMANAQLDNTSVDIKAGKEPVAPAEMPYLFRATGSVIRFPGFLAVYQESVDDDAQDEELSKKALPPLVLHEPLNLLQLLPEQHFTQPPPRYTEASLVKMLEELGIGRPSTYAPTLGTIQERYYVTKQEKKFVPTELGLLVNDMLTEHFPNILDSNFTSQMEDNLDEIAGGEKNWVPVLANFYEPFEVTVTKAESVMAKVIIIPEPAGVDCEICGKPMVIKLGKFGRFMACSGWPDCRNAKPILKKIGMKCPSCHEGELAVKTTKKKRVFYGCTRYPECEFTLWDRPIPQACPECAGLMTMSGRHNAKCTNCGTKIEYEMPEEVNEGLGNIRIAIRPPDPPTTEPTREPEKAAV